MTSRREFIAGGVAATAGLLSRRFCGAQVGCPKPEKIAKAGYLRLYGSAETIPGKDILAQLARCMTSNPSPDDGSSITPGYTYFGQFIDHDLTWNADVEFDAPEKEQENARNFRSPFLDLDSVYGAGPPLDCQYTGQPGEESFIISETTPSPRFGLKGGSLRDVPFEDGNRPVIGDRADLRNTENLILRQLHVVFLKFHNRVIAELPERIKDHDPSVPAGPTLFARAQKLVRWTYQWLVWKDFLPQFRPEDRLQRKLERIVIRELFALPLEFVLAAFRFGHSMVRNNYALNCHHDFPHNAVDLGNLVNQSKETAERLAEENVIDWRQFFPGVSKRKVSGSVAPIRASKIDTHIAPALGELAPGTFRAFATPSGRGDENPSLPYHTLVRGACARLASGQQVAGALKKKRPEIQDISGALKEDEYLKETKLTENTPLWYYILKEAEVRFPDVDALGELGFYLVEDGIAAALQHDSDSFLYQGDNWHPPTWILAEENQTVNGLISFAKANEPVEGCAEETTHDAAPQH